MNDLCYGFDPIVPENPKLLILGTMPSVQSLAQSFYYAHPRNSFWPIMATIFNEAFTNQDEKIRFCLEKNIMVWDVLKTCQRVGSLDSQIKKPEANDFEAVFNRFPDLQHVFFNGKKAAQLFNQHVIKKQKLPELIQFHEMPSTSPANARLTIENKRDFWQASLSKIF